MIGKQILNYTVEKLLGEGGMGSVYLARHVQLGRKVAIKVLNPGLVRNPQIRERFRNEAATLATLQHPTIVTLYDYLEEEDGLYLIMEYVEGRALDDYIRHVSGPIPEAKVIQIFSQVLDGFDYAHRKGIVHRDIKPANLILTPDGDTRILDFGIARIVGNDANHRLTQAGSKMGTVLYMSPEQVKAEAVDKRSDIYSLGVTLFELLTGRPPYNDANTTEYQVYQQIVNQPLPPARSFYPSVSDRMQALISKATAKLPADRFADCVAFKQALLNESIVPQGTGTLPPPPAPVERATPPPTGSVITPALKTPVASPIIEQRRPRRSSTGIWILLGLVSLGLLVFTLLRQNGEAASTVERPNPYATNGENAPVTEQSGENPTMPSEVLIDTTTAPTDGTPMDENEDPAVVEDNRIKELLTSLRLKAEPLNLTPAAGVPQDEIFSLRVSLQNPQTQVTFKNLRLKFTYYDEYNNPVEFYSFEYGTLKPGANDQFDVNRKIKAVRATVEPESAEVEEEAAG